MMRQEKRTGRITAGIPAKTGETGSRVNVVCLALNNERGEYLSVCRPHGKRMAGYWEFPGGKMEEGETPEDALRREIREELHLDLGYLEPLTPVEHRYDFATVNLIPFLGCLPRPSFLLAEHSGFRWLKPDDLLTVVWTPADMPIVEQLRERALRLRTDGGRKGIR